MIPSLPRSWDHEIQWTVAEHRWDWIWVRVTRLKTSCDVWGLHGVILLAKGKDWRRWPGACALWWLQQQQRTLLEAFTEMRDKEWQTKTLTYSVRLGLLWRSGDQTDPWEPCLSSRFRGVIGKTSQNEGTETVAPPRPSRTSVWTELPAHFTGLPEHTSLQPPIARLSTKFNRSLMLVRPARKWSLRRILQEKLFLYFSPSLAPGT